MHQKLVSVILLLSISTLWSDCSISQKRKTNLEGYTILFNGKNLDGWMLMTRKKDPELPAKVFSIGENGTVHVFKNFPDGYQLDQGKSHTHGLMFTQKSYSRYSFTFEYKWGKKKLNNFDKFQYDAGCYYHVYEQKVWPKGLEYQVRYNNYTNENHTGDFWNSGARMQWYAGSDGRFQLPSEGGKPQEIRGGEHRCKADVPYHALDDQWNVCEIIVMGNQYAIHKLNGEIVNYATNLSHAEGPIGLQSETAEIFYRNIAIKEFEEDIPAKQFLK